MAMLSRLQARRVTSAQSWKEKSLFMQMRTSLNRLLSQATAMASRGNPAIGLDEGLRHIVGLDHDRLVQRDEFGGNFDRRARLAHRFEIGARRKPGAGSVTIPFMEDQPRARHQVEHAADDRAVEPRRRHLAERRKALLVLRPQPVHHEGKRPPARIAGRAPARARVPARPRNKTATRTAPAHRNRIGRAHSAGGPAPRRRWQTRSRKLRATAAACAALLRR